MSSLPKFPLEPENSLREKLIRSIWLHRDKYCYLFEPDGSYRLLSTDRQGQYTGMYLCGYNFWLDDRQTGSPESGAMPQGGGYAIGAATGFIRLDWLRTRGLVGCEL